MSNEERILELLGQINGRLDKVDSRLDSLEAGQEELRAGQAQTKDRLDKLEETVTKMSLTLDYQVLPPLNDMGEVQADMHDRIKNELATKEDLSSLEADQRLLAGIVARHSREIAELKQA